MLLFWESEWLRNEQAASNNKDKQRNIVSQKSSDVRDSEQNPWILFPFISVKPLVHSLLSFLVLLIWLSFFSFNLVKIWLLCSCLYYFLYLYLNFYFPHGRSSLLSLKYAVVKPGKIGYACNTNPLEADAKSSPQVWDIALRARVSHKIPPKEMVLCLQRLFLSFTIVMLQHRLQIKGKKRTLTQMNIQAIQ